MKISEIWLKWQKGVWGSNFIISFSNFMLDLLLSILKFKVLLFLNFLMIASFTMKKVYLWWLSFHYKNNKGLIVRLNLIFMLYHFCYMISMLKKFALWYLYFYYISSFGIWFNAIGFVFKITMHLVLKLYTFLCFGT